jgi:hypothetical protein
MADILDPTPSAPLIERPKSYEELRTRPAFREVLDQKEHELRRVLSDYHFAALTPCGLRDCRKQHRDGFLVETMDGLETNVGHVCGRNTFGEAFDIASAAHARERKRQDLVKRARSALAEGERVKRRIADLNRGRFGIKWVDSVRRTFRELLGVDLLDSLGAAHVRGELIVTTSRERSNEEIDDIAGRTHQSRERLRYETTAMGTLEPMPWIAFDFHERLRGGLLIPLEHLALLDLDKTPSPKLSAAVKPFDGWETTVAEAEEAAASALRSLSVENLALVVQWIPDHMAARRRALSGWIGSKAHGSLMAGAQSPTAAALAA